MSGLRSRSVSSHRLVAFLCVATWWTVPPVAAEGQHSPIRLAKPSAKQVEFADWEVGAFIHYGLNPFTNQEHGDGQEPPAKFNPTQLDTDQWARTAKALGARYAVLTARHEGGFCLWPSKTTDYTIANSPYQNGEGDIVRDFVASCRRHGLKVGLYHTAGFNAHEALRDYQAKSQLDQPLEWGKSWGRAVSSAFKADPTLRARFDAVQVEQFRELLTNYGTIDFMWSDHWDATDSKGVWRAVTDLAEELQPNMVMMGPDTWVPGNETGHVVYPMWNAVNTADGTHYSRPARTESDVSVKNDYGLLETDVLTGHPLGRFWRVRECTTHAAFHYGGWFWHPDEVKKTYPRSLSDHVDLYYRTVGLGANTIINLPPDTRGLIPDDIRDAAQALGDAVRERFAEPLAEVDAVQVGDTVELAWEVPQEINTIVTRENIANGQRIAKYTLEAYVEGEWRPLEPRNRLDAWSPYNSSPGFETIGHKKIDRVSPVTTNRVRFRCLESVVSPVEIRSLAVYRCEPNPRNFPTTYPYLSGVETEYELAHGGVRRDVNYTGHEIVIRGVPYEHGVMACPTGADRKSVVEYALAGLTKARGLQTLVGLDDGALGRGSCVFRIDGYRGGEWSTLAQSPRLTGKDEPVQMTVAFPDGMAKLRLLVTNGGDDSHSDHAVWADARFTESVSASPAP
ncbi:Alpha-L-fucosidase [Planctomycetes bacterium MalM25]|nr:Alpha-L-fucosidase [Planctomycetes bacterium MalM25]